MTLGIELRKIGQQRWVRGPGPGRTLIAGARRVEGKAPHVKLDAAMGAMPAEALALRHVRGNARRPASLWLVNPAVTDGEVKPPLVMQYVADIDAGNDRPKLELKLYGGHAIEVPPGSWRVTVALPGQPATGIEIVLETDDRDMPPEIVELATSRTLAGFTRAPVPSHDSTAWKVLGLLAGGKLGYRFRSGVVPSHATIAAGAGEEKEWIKEQIRQAQKNLPVLSGATPGTWCEYLVDIEFFTPPTLRQLFADFEAGVLFADATV